MGILKVKTEQILLEESFTISYPLYEEKLYESIKKVGLLSYPILKKEKDKFKIICGKRRIFVLKKLGIKEFEALVIKISNKDAFILGFLDNLAKRDLNLVEKINVLKGLKEICKLSWSQIAENFSQSLNLPSNPHYLNKIYYIHELEDSAKILLCKERINLETCLRLLRLNETERKVFLEVFNKLFLGRNKANDLLDFYFKIRNKRSQKDILKKIQSFLKKEHTSPKQLFQTLREYLFRKAYPRYSAAKDKVKNLINNLKLQDIKVEFPQNFEEKELIFSFKVQNIKDFITKVNALSHIDKEKLSEIFKTL